MGKSSRYRSTLDQSPSTRHNDFDDRLYLRDPTTAAKRSSIALKTPAVAFGQLVKCPIQNEAMVRKESDPSQRTATRF
jgi:hypothetical protein